MSSGEERELGRLVAELEVLARFDWLRSLAGHDYGAGQRASELIRRRRELGRDELRACSELEALEPSRARLEAWVSVGFPRFRRLLSEGYRANTPATSRTAATWGAVARELVPDDWKAYARQYGTLEALERARVSS